MARICVVGSGYVGTVVAAGMAEIGHEVVALEVDEAKRQALTEGLVPFHEPDLPELVRRNVERDRLRFTGSPLEAMASSDVVFLCVGTPSAADGHADLSALGSALASLRQAATHHHVLITKSTVPIGTHAWILEQLSDPSGAGRPRFSLVSNPEFLRQGSAVSDFLFPERIVIGSDDPLALDVVEEVYRPILEQDLIDLRGGRAKARGATLLRTSLATAETIKYASNAFLATKISFANEMAAICDLVGADITEVVAGMGLDDRIGAKFLNAGLGWGGSCFGKDVRALIATAGSLGQDTPILQATHRVNFAQRERVVEKVEAALGSLAGARVCLLGLSFKPHTDDLRDAPSLDIAERLAARGAIVRGHDPVVVQLPPGSAVVRDSSPYDAATGCDAVVLVTEWPEYLYLDWEELALTMRGQVLVDGRNALDRDAVERAGLVYHGIGRPATPAAALGGALGHVRVGVLS